MSIVEATSRVAEIQALVQRAIAPAAPAATTTATTGGTAASASSFASSLLTAQGSDVAGAATDVGVLPAATSATGFPATGATTASAASATGASGDAGPYAGMIQAAAVRNGVDPQIFTNLVRQESGFDPGAGSSAGAQGLCQLMPGTAASLGVTDPLDPAQSLEGGAKYLRQQLDRFGGDYAKALAAYNAGPGAVERFGGIPPYAETQHYVQTILGARGTA